jgi:hypothetical protein
MRAQRSDLFEDAHMATAIAEERGWRHHQDAERGAALLGLPLALIRHHRPGPERLTHIGTLPAQLAREFLATRARGSENVDCSDRGATRVRPQPDASRLASVGSVREGLGCGANQAGRKMLIGTALARDVKLAHARGNTGHPIHGEPSLEPRRPVDVRTCLAATIARLGAYRRHGLEGRGHHDSRGTLLEDEPEEECSQKGKSQSHPPTIRVSADECQSPPTACRGTNRVDGRRSATPNPEWRWPSTFRWPFTHRFAT